MPLRLHIPSFENRKVWVSCPTTSLSCAYEDNLISHAKKNLCFKWPWSTVPLISNLRAIPRETFFFSDIVLLKWGEPCLDKMKKKPHGEESVHKRASVTGRLQDKLPKARRSEVKACAPSSLVIPSAPVIYWGSWIRKIHYTLSVLLLLSPT